MLCLSVCFLTFVNLVMPVLSSMLKTRFRMDQLRPLTLFSMLFLTSMMFEYIWYAAGVVRAQRLTSRLPILTQRTDPFHHFYLSKDHAMEVD
jgi:hypothetical protein